MIKRFIGRKHVLWAVENFADVFSFFFKTFTLVISWMCTIHVHVGLADWSWLLVWYVMSDSLMLDFYGLYVKQKTPFLGTFQGKFLNCCQRKKNLAISQRKDPWWRNWHYAGTKGGVLCKKSQSSVGCCRPSHDFAKEEFSMSWTWTHSYCIGERLVGHYPALAWRRPEQWSPPPIKMECTGSFNRHVFSVLLNFYLIPTLVVLAKVIFADVSLMQ